MTASSLPPLHDATVERVSNDAAAGVVRLEAELAEGAGGERGVLFFRGVRELSAEPALEQVEWGPDCDGGIVEARLDGDDEIRATLVIEVAQYSEKRRSVLTVKLVADEVGWEPGGG